MEDGKKRAVPNYDTYLKLVSIIIIIIIIIVIITIIILLIIIIKGITNVIQFGEALNDIPDGPDLPSSD